MHGFAYRVILLRVTVVEKINGLFCKSTLQNLVCSKLHGQLDQCKHYGRVKLTLLISCYCTMSLHKAYTK